MEDVAVGLLARWSKAFCKFPDLAAAAAQSVPPRNKHLAVRWNDAQLSVPYAHGEGSTAMDALVRQEEARVVMCVQLTRALRRAEVRRRSRRRAPSAGSPGPTDTCLYFVKWRAGAPLTVVSAGHPVDLLAGGDVLTAVFKRFVPSPRAPTPGAQPVCTLALRCTAATSVPPGMFLNYGNDRVVEIPLYHGATVADAIAWHPLLALTPAASRSLTRRQGDVGWAGLSTALLMQEFLSDGWALFGEMTSPWEPSADVRLLPAAPSRHPVALRAGQPCGVHVDTINRYYAPDTDERPPTGRLPLCYICLGLPVACVLVPCGHTLCMGCSGRVLHDGCYYCKVRVTSVQRVFFQD